MGELRSVVEELLALCLQRISMEESGLSADMELIELVRNMEVMRKNWLHAEVELKKYKELLVKSDVAKAALEVKLKHARNQLDVEMRKRYKSEADYQYLKRQMELMCDILVHDSKSSASLNAEQKSLLAAFEQKAASATLRRGSKRLSVIDESSFLSHSDISYDRTDDNVDLDATLLKPLKSRVRERRRSSMGLTLVAPTEKRARSGNVSAELLEREPVEKEVETVVKALVTSPGTGGPTLMELGITQKRPATPGQSVTQQCTISVGGGGWRLPPAVMGAAGDRSLLAVLPCSPVADAQPSRPPGKLTTGQDAGRPSRNPYRSLRDQTTVLSPSDDATVETAAKPPRDPRSVDARSVDARSVDANRAHKIVKHVFLSKTVIRPETCIPCGKRMRFGKMAVKCKNCRVFAHPECKEKFTSGCSTSNDRRASTAQMGSLEGSALLAHPRVPQLVVDCVAEIERRGLQERGLYRVPGGERPVRDLREGLLQGKSALLLSKVQDIHVVCGVLKDFLRKLKEPLITFRLHRTFMEAAELADVDSGAAIMSKVISELPKANRDTLAFLMLHLHKVIRSPKCQMDRNNLSRVFGPTIVGHGLPEPSPTTIMRDTNTQPKVVSRLFSLPEDYWRRILMAPSDQAPSATSSSKTTPEEGHGRLFKPLTSPELNNFYKITSPGSIRGRIMNQGNASSSIAQPDPVKKFFSSPS
ncbi:rac GTPase-activating protein 1 [Cololabis saira]|uniref:rac GTPase-activating protein 1 n=1 Tax=Cololabis saira TaxID=129043 RepID=UPI002AD51AA9|nr:rac GTPase-activating protein 1 [Cololabis saira]